jgi:phage/plasmid-like protein (TIGR03299 family)
MAHEIESNYAFFASSTPAWHGLGTVLKDAPSIPEAWELACGGMTLHELPAFAGIQDSEGQFQYQPVDDKKHIFRSDGRYIGTVGDGYHLLQYVDGFRQFEGLIDSGLVELEAGGLLRDGKRMWALGKVKDAVADVAPGDTVKGYILFYSGFDGSLSAGMGSTTVRVVCANTLAAARNEGIQYKFRHTASMPQRLEDARNAIRKEVEAFRVQADLYRHLAAKKVSRKAQEEYITAVMTPESQKEGEDLSTRAENTIRYVIDLIDTQRNLELVPATRGTAWQAYNAVSEYLTHDYGNNQDNRLNAQWFGNTAALNRRALVAAQAM